MSRGTTLVNLRALLKAEIRDAQETNAYADAEYNYSLANKQTDLAFAYDWSFLSRKWDLACATGSRYLSIPTADIRGTAATINFERPLLVERLYNTKYQMLEYGITSQQLNWRNSDLGQPLDPIQRWQLVTNTSETSNADQIEVWPIPASNQTVRFTGQRNVYTLTGDADRADLDDLLIVYHVAADYLMHRDQANATLVLKKANDRLIRLRAGYPTLSDPVVFGHKSTYEREVRRITPLVVVS